MNSHIGRSRPARRPLAVGLTVVALVFGLAACSNSDDDSASEPRSSSGATTSGGDCGVRKVGDVQVRTYCGTGTASATSTTTKLTLPKAACESSADYVSASAGTVVLSSGAAADKVRATTQYIGVLVGRVPGDTASKPAATDGTYSGAVVTVNDKATRLLVDPAKTSVTLTNGRTAGTFTGTLSGGGGTVTGSFTCA